MLARLQKAPSAFKPVNNPRRAKTRQQYVLRRMHVLRFVNDDQLREAQNAPLGVRQGLREALPTHAEFVAEMARQVVFDTYGEDAYTRGLTVWTTVRKADQEAAYSAIRRGVIDYDRRHGYRGPEAVVSLPDDPAEQDAALDRVFQDSPDSDNLLAAVVLQATAADVRAVLANGDQIQVNGDGLKFVARALTDKAPAAQRIRRGAVIRVIRDEKGRYAITSLPQAEASFIDVSPPEGAMYALVVGCDYYRHKINHVQRGR